MKKTSNHKVTLSQALSQAKKAVKKGHFSDAIQIYQSILAEQPNHPVAKKNLRNLLKKSSNLSLTSCSSDKPSEKQINSLKSIFNSGDMVQTEVSCNKILEFHPHSIIILDVLAASLIGQEKFSQAIIVYDHVIKLNPNHFLAYNNRGNALRTLGLNEDALTSLNKAIQLKPDYFEAYCNRGNILDDLGQPNEALISYDTSIQINPNFAGAYSCRALLLNYCLNISDQEIYFKHRDFGKLLEHRIQTHLYNRSARITNARLKIGYISPDFNSHSVAFFFTPVLMAHNTKLFECYCYYNNNKVDATTQLLTNIAEHWRDIANLDDKSVATLISNDNIDILIDLAGHTKNNRLSIFPYKAAPVQITWLGYPNTTGLTTMDYRFTDELCDPIGLSDEFYSEKLIRFSDGFLCYQGDASIPKGNYLPYSKNGYFTFASFNNVTKLNKQVISLWSTLLKSVSNSILVLKSNQLTDSFTKSRIISLFKTEGIDSNRIKLYSTFAKRSDHFALYNSIDIALDPFPYNGTTTTCEALWMGIPVISLVGNRHAGRVGLSILTRLGLEELVAKNESEYINIALRLTHNINHLTQLRMLLRDKMISSPLCDSSAFTCTLEKMYVKLFNTFLDSIE